jgi:dTDP-4-amino-4,6-dideoxyglucose
VFSFHATKFVNAFEGGAIVTDDPYLADRARAMRAFGSRARGDSVSGGTNAKMTEACAAMGLCSLDEAPAIVERNLANHAAYAAGLRGVPGLDVLGWDPADRTNAQYVVLIVGPSCPLDRATLEAALEADGVRTRAYFVPPAHRLAPFRDASPGLPATEALSEQVSCLPTGLAVQPEQAAAVASRIALLVARAGEVTSAVRGRS